jgi:hypothetical protein
VLIRLVLTFHSLKSGLGCWGQAQSITLTNILDDTGSTYLELSDDDCLLLGLTPGCHGWGNDVLLDTANGQVRRESIDVEVQLLVNGAPFGPIANVIATITPGMGQDELRCSGNVSQRLPLHCYLPEWAWKIISLGQENGRYSTPPCRLVINLPFRDSTDTQLFEMSDHIYRLPGYSSADLFARGNSGFLYRKPHGCRTVTYPPSYAFADLRNECNIYTVDVADALRKIKKKGAEAS